MKLEYENFAEVLSIPKVEKKNDTFMRNQPAKAGEQQEGEEEEGGAGFERKQINRGGGFSRGRGRGRGAAAN